MRGRPGRDKTAARSRQPRILVVSHEASRTGAPRVAIEILQALGGTEWDRSVVLRWPGPLRVEFVATGATVVNEPLRRLRVLLRKWPRSRWLANHLEQFSATLVILWKRPDVVWCNTALSACYVKPGFRRGLGVVLHAHEQRDWMALVLQRYNLDRQWSSTVLVGCAPRVCSDLAALTGRPETDVVCLPSVPDRRRICDLAGGSGGPVPTTPGVLVGACGSASENKGVDLWLEMVTRIAPLISDLRPRFVWIGADPPENYAARASEQGLSQLVTFTGSLENPYPWLAALDVFTFTSRADAFPLVVLEAMHLGRAVVAFAVGDVPRQVGTAGKLVPALDVARAGEEVVALLRDPAERSRLGAAAAARAKQQFPVSAFREGVLKLATEAKRRAREDDGRAER